MRILIVEDNRLKEMKIASVVKEVTSINNIFCADNNFDAIRKIKTDDKFDLVILDLMLPIRKGESPRKDGGLILLNEIIRRNDIVNPDHIIGLTAFDEIKKEIDEEFNKEGWVIITFDLKSIDWEVIIKNKIIYILNSKKNQPIIIMKSKILFIAASPEDQSKLNAGMEQRKIDEALSLSSNRDKFELLSKTGAKFETLSRVLMQSTPEYIHFTGHGDHNCLAFEQDNGQTHEVPSDALEKLFKILCENTKCVFLSACYSSNQAKAISSNNIYVIGMNNSVEIKAATAFALGFYQAISENKEIPNAFAVGEAHYLSVCAITDKQFPELWLNGFKIN
tara:strand:- start:444 stop:1451 length:1008 start_codon:yes stop_codon:yes gene_type:complete